MIEIPSDVHAIIDVAIGVACAESLKYLVIKVWEYVDHHVDTPLDIEEEK